MSAPYGRPTRIADLRKGDWVLVDMPRSPRAWRLVVRVGATGIAAYDSHGRFCWYHPSRVERCCRVCETAEPKRDAPCPSCGRFA